MKHARQDNFVLFGLILALWPVWRQLALRAGDGSDQPLGLVALAALIFFGLRPGEGRQNWLPATVLTFLYAVLLPSAPFLVVGVLGTLALGCALSARAGTKVQPGLLGLAVLSLPLLASLQFYLGYPLRVGVAHLAKLFLAVTGRNITVSGTALEWGPHLVSVDSPCSGVQMLWAGLFLVFFLAARDYWSFERTLWVGSLSIGLVLLGNAVRAASLFLVETSPMKQLDGLHESLGVGAFVSVALSILWLASRCRGEARVQPSEVSRARGWFLGMCLLAGLAGFAPVERASQATGPFPGWPERFEGRALEPMQLSSEEARFVEGFPGQVGRFHDGRREIIIRWVWSPTRRLHPASDCLKGVGYSTVPGPLTGSPPWSSFRARKGNKSLRVREQIVDADGRSFPDVSTWYWAATLGRSRGPWWSYSVAEKSQKEHHE